MFGWAKKRIKSGKKNTRLYQLLNVRLTQFYTMLGKSVCVHMHDCVLPCDWLLSCPGCIPTLVQWLLEITNSCPMTLWGYVGINIWLLDFQEKKTEKQALSLRSESIVNYFTTKNIQNIISKLKYWNEIW